MSVITINNPQYADISVRQDKYNDRNFRKDLANSNDLVYFIAKVAYNYGADVRPNDDSVPFKNKFGKVRYEDILLRYNGNLQRIEAKDIASLAVFNGTGLQRAYIDKISGGIYDEKIILVFKENNYLIRTRLKSVKYSGSLKSILDELIAKQFVAEIGGRLVFIPYGNNLGFLMQNRDVFLEERIKSILDNGYGKEQYCWSLDNMMPLHKIIANMFNVRVDNVLNVMCEMLKDKYDNNIFGRINMPYYDMLVDSFQEHR